ncbi:hypothetical protein RB195_012851 [Necator americanus]|uniref:PAN domain protein n=1 Tax=Necator americanus TaxID=51031 RepID=A0ABR1DSV2_NECAM
MHGGSILNWIKLALHLAQMTPLLTSTFFPREHEFNAAEKYQITLGTLDLCMSACYEENDCTFVKYDEGVCTIYIDGTDVQLPSDRVFEINRNLTDPSCECKISTPKEMAFKRIAAKTRDTRLCRETPNDVTAVYEYVKDSLRFYSTDSSGFLPGGTRPNYNSVLSKVGEGIAHPGNIFARLEFLFTRNPEPQCTAVPVFVRANHRRLFFGDVYNTTGYYFLNGYVYAESCRCISGECCGTTAATTVCGVSCIAENASDIEAVISIKKYTIYSGDGDKKKVEGCATAEDYHKDAFCGELNTLISKTPTQQTVVFRADTNTKTVREQQYDENGR